MAVTNLSTANDIFLEVRQILIDANITYDGQDAQILNALDDNYDGTKPALIIDPAEIDETLSLFGSNDGNKIINIIVAAYFKTTGGVDSLSDQAKRALKDNKISGVALNQLIDNNDLNVGDQNKYNSKATTFVYNRYVG